MIAIAAGLALALVQLPEPPAYTDNRLQSVAYDAGEVVPISTAPGYQVTVLLAPDERILSVAVGDSGAWQVTANQGGNILFVKLTQPGLATNMTVITDVRIYAFDLLPGDAMGGMPYTLQFAYPKAAAADEAPLDLVAGYRMSGSKSLWPEAIGDDGDKTYIEWPDDVDLPAVYALDQAGREVLVNGNVRDGRFVLDSVADRLVFRIDRRVAKAKRRPLEDQDPLKDQGS